MGSIITSYSYKGGVGRSMALANVSVLLARQGLRVLSVDWDLEAPGLERYFSYFRVIRSGPGLLRMCMDALDGKKNINYESYCSTIDCDTVYPISLLTSGREFLITRIRIILSVLIGICFFVRTAVSLSNV